jgi:hypothetical protein
MNHIANPGKLTWRPGRRLLASAGLAGAALLLPAVALAAQTGPGAARATASRCAGTHTMVWIGEPGDSGAGSTHYQLEFSNVGRTACTLSGYPRVIAADENGHPVGKPAGKVASAMPVLTLRPGGTVHVVLEVTDPGIACPGRAVATSQLLVYPPHQGWQFVPLASGACSGQVSMSVDAVHPGAGIPRHSAS